MWLLLYACAPAPADFFLAYQRTSESYEVAPRTLPGLDDPATMTGALGQVWSGGTLELTDEGNFTYRRGAPLDLRFQVVDGVAWPMDEDGLVLFSFWGHLADTVDGLDALGLQLGEVIPVDMAWAPTLPDLLFELFPAENAAYATGGNLFVLLPDGRAEGVPLVANAGVVAHETGHALFQLLTTGDPYAPAAWREDDPIGGNYQSALHEGFADTVAALLLDDPRFLDASVVAEARWLDAGAASNDPGLTLPEDFDASTSVFALYDPYPLGTLYASLAWDIRLASADPGGTLLLASDAAVAWSDGLQDGWSDEDRFSYVEALVAGTEGEVRAAACASAAQHLPDVELSACAP